MDPISLFGKGRSIFYSQLKNIDYVIATVEPDEPADDASDEEKENLTRRIINAIAAENLDTSGLNAARGRSQMTGRIILMTKTAARGTNPLKLQGFTDADWQGDPDDRKSTSGYLFTLAGGAVSWRSKKQESVALSSMEAEYIAASEAVKEVVWLREFLASLKFIEKGI